MKLTKNQKHDIPWYVLLPVGIACIFASGFGLFKGNILPGIISLIGFASFFGAFIDLIQKARKNKK